MTSLKLKTLKIDTGNSKFVKDNEIDGDNDLIVNS